MSEILELCWLFVKRAREAKLDNDYIRWVLDETLKRFESFEILTRASVNEITLEGEP